MFLDARRLAWSQGDGGGTRDLVWSAARSYEGIGGAEPRRLPIRSSESEPVARPITYIRRKRSCVERRRPGVRLGPGEPGLRGSTQVWSCGNR
jgi:hypothetical protein